MKVFRYTNAVSVISVHLAVLTAFVSIKESVADTTTPMETAVKEANQIFRKVLSEIKKEVEELEKELSESPYAAELLQKHEDAPEIRETMKRWEKIAQNCSCPPGLPGIKGYPGLPGYPGLQGMQGMKGEKAEIHCAID